MYLSVVYVENNTDCRYYGLSGAPKSYFIYYFWLIWHIVAIKPKSVIRLLCANKLSFCYLPFRFSVTMEPHCALKT